MPLPFDHELEGLMEEYRKSRARTAELQRQIREISATAMTPRQTVKVKVGAQGDLLGIEFPTGAYKRMAPNELSEAILGAVAEAKSKALDALRELMLPVLPRGLNFVDLIQGKADLTQAMPEEPPMPDAVRDYIESGQVPGQPPGGLNG
jgi:DNA-binding protein YbaB